MYIKCILMGVPWAVVVDNFIDHIRDTARPRAVLDVMSIFDSDNGSFLDGVICFSEATLASKEIFNAEILQRELVGRNRRTIRLPYEASLFIERNTNAQEDERFPSRFDLGEWTMEEGLSSMFRRKYRRGEPQHFTSEQFTAMAMSSSRVQQQGQDHPAPRVSYEDIERIRTSLYGREALHAASYGRAEGIRFAPSDGQSGESTGDSVSSRPTPF